VPGPEARVDALQAEEAVREQAGASEEHERQRNLRDDERRASAGSPAPAIARFLDDGSRIRPRRLQRRKNAEEQPGRKRREQRHHHHGNIEPDRIGSRQPARHDPQQHGEQP
jgi:hypothetical protein